MKKNKSLDLNKKFKYFLIPYLKKLESSNSNNYKTLLNSLAIRHPNRNYLKYYLLNKSKNENIIIDDFIKNDPKIIRKKNIQNKNEDLSKNTNDVFDFESENLAKIFIKQNKLNKAIKIYKKLILKNSKKKVYFAKKIEDLKS